MDRYRRFLNTENKSKRKNFISSSCFQSARWIFQAPYRKYAKIENVHTFYILKGTSLSYRWYFRFSNFIPKRHIALSNGDKPFDAKLDLKLGLKASGHLSACINLERSRGFLFFQVLFFGRCYNQGRATIEGSFR